MKKFNLNLIMGALIIASMLTFVSCSKDQEVLNSTLAIEETQLPALPEATPVLAENIAVQNGMLVFTSLESFRNTVLALNKMNSLEQLAWEKQLGFTSMQQLFNSVMSAEFETVGMHSAIYQTQLQAGLIVENTASGLYDLNLFNPAYAPILNGQGLVLVGHTLYQFTGNSLKIWEYGDINRLEYLLNASVANDHIQIVPMNYEAAVQRNVPVWSDQCESTDGNGMLRLTVSYNSDYLEGNPEVIFIDYFINVVSMIKTANDEWEYDPDATVRLIGRSHIRFTVTDGNIERTRDLIRPYGPLIGFGGNYTFIPLENGQYSFGSPWTFVNPAHLLRSDWSAQNKLSDGSIFSCSLTF